MTDLRQGRRVAFKFLPVPLADEPMALGRFRRELRRERMPEGLKYPLKSSPIPVDDPYGRS